MLEVVFFSICALIEQSCQEPHHVHVFTAITAAACVSDFKIPGSLDIGMTW